jgi:hypothetical protein
MLEERLGYKFSMTELPPSLRAKYAVLEKEYADLEGKRIELQREPDLLKRMIDEKYSREYDSIIRRKMEELDEARKRSEMLKKRYRILSFILGALGFFCGIFITALIGTAILFSLGPSASASTWNTIIVGGSLLGFFTICPLCAITFARIPGRFASKQELRVKEKEEELNKIKSDIENRKESELRAELEQRLPVLKEELDSFEKKFEADLNQMAFEINSTLSAIFQSKIEAESMRWLDGTIEKVRRFIREVEET